MIEYALLFGLGVLSAAFVAMLLAPPIHGRIVRYTENRLRATMPLTPQEIRAQRDMARAAYAAENARTSQELERERDRAVALQIKSDTLSKEAGKLLAENQDFRQQVDAMGVEAADLRARLRREETQLLQLREALKRSEDVTAKKDAEIEKLMARIDGLAREVDNLKIERANREADIEALKVRLQSLRDEREEMRREQSSAVQRAREAEQRLQQEEHQRLRLDDRLIREMAGNADKETIIDRRVAEIARLKEKLKQANAQLRRGARGDKAGDLSAAQGYDISDEEPAMESEIAVDALKEDVTHQFTALTERLNRSRAGNGALVGAAEDQQDEALRDEIADIAAKMIVLTAANEGEGSPIPKLIASQPAAPRGPRTSLADRVRSRNPHLTDGQA